MPQGQLPPPMPIYTLRSNDGGINRVLFKSNENQLVSGSSKGVITTWCLKSFRSVCSWKTHEGKGILWLGYKNKILYTQGRDGYLRLWNDHESHWLENEKISIPSIGFCPCDLMSDDILILPGENDQIRMNSLATKLDSSILKLKKESKFGMCMSLKASEASDIKTVTAGYENGSIVMWDCRNPNQPLADCNFYDEPIMCLDYDITVRKGICGSVGNSLCVWTCQGEKIETLRTLSLTNPGLSSARIRNDHVIFAAGGWDGRLRIFGLKKLRPLAVLLHHKESIECLSFSDEPINGYGQLLAAGSKDQRISLWNLYTK